MVCNPLFEILSNEVNLKNNFFFFFLFCLYYILILGPGGDGANMGDDDDASGSKDPDSDRYITNFMIVVFLTNPMKCSNSLSAIQILFLSFFFLFAD